MKFGVTIALVWLTAVICWAQSREDGKTNAPPSGASGTPQPTVSETIRAKVTCVADSSKMRMLVWVVTFREKDGSEHNCLVRPKDPFFREIGLDKLTYQQIVDKKDYADLPWYEIVIGGETKHYGRLISWKAMKKDAEQEH